ncbi:WYL domain-containing protein [Stenotrophomonas sp. W1S232]|uniref:WYL domain-containing protein n=1 Tax=Stenotrophomonas koreensis TaxID=266128 RepID=A0A7W3V1A2_9GAMM|nr:WYL domain-containing protein [Stenotrophomonas koreensis]MBB1117596.1 WYL domain-containing protein [Stenotrophomonas koreensis]
MEEPVVCMKNDALPSAPKDPLLRNLILLRMIPRHPGSISTIELRDALEREGFQISLRSLQRDLDGKLSQHFDLLCSKDDPDPAIASLRPYRWSYQPHVRPGLPLMSAAEAMAFQLCEGHLRHLLPPGVLGQLEPHFAEARQTLNKREGSRHAHWLDRVRSLPNGKALLPAVVAPEVWENVATAVLEQRQLQVDYFSRAKGEVKTMTLHPKGLVSRGPTTYLIASVGDYTDIRHFALHRIQKAGVLDAPSRDCEFDIDTYLPMAAFTPRKSTGMVNLVADVDSRLAQTLQETPLSKDQRLELLEGTDSIQLHAQLPDDLESFWWLYSLGDSIRVLHPTALRMAILERNKRVISLYR